MPDTEIILDYEKVITAIGAEIKNVWNDLLASEDKEVVSLMSSIKNIQVSDEQFFRKQETDRKLRRGSVYLVVKFGSGAINFGSSVTPISIYALGVANQVKPVQLLLGTFSSRWTTLNLLQGLDGEISDMLQLWNTPEVVSNFNIVDEDFRNLYKVTGNIVLGPAAVRVGTLTYYYMENGTEKSKVINIMAFHDNYHASLNTQPMMNTKGFAKSEANFSTYTFSISTYLLAGKFSEDILSISGFRKRPFVGNTQVRAYDSTTSKFDPNDEMKLEIAFTNDYNNLPTSTELPSDSDPIKGDDFFAYFKVVDYQTDQRLGEIATLNVTFTR